MNLPGKLFGVALDVSDDPWTHRLKLAAAEVRDCMPDLHADPYEAALAALAARGHRIASCGKFAVPSWQWPLPLPGDQIDPTRMRHFVESGGLRQTAARLQAFVDESILPDLPVMVGVDHSATGGVVTALSNRLGADQLSVVVLDRHFDGLSVAERLGGGQEGGQPLPDWIDGASQYCCGNFWAHLIDEGIVLARNLIFVGVADLPAGDEASSARGAAYADFTRRGCSFFTLADFAGAYHERLRRFLADQITTPHLYVSLDVDVGTDRCVAAARYMDGPGLDREEILTVARLVAEGVDSGRFRLAGVDLMEFNMHLLGVEIAPGETDQTMSLAIDFLEVLIGSATQARQPVGAKPMPFPIICGERG